MKKNIKIILYIVLGLSLAGFICGIVLLNLNCNGDCDTVAHGGVLISECPKIYNLFPPAGSAVLIVLGAVGIIAVVAFFAVFSILAERKIMAEIKASAEASKKTESSENAETEIKAEVAESPEANVAENAEKP